MNVSELISKKWVRLEKPDELDKCRFPGVYILSYSNLDLESKTIDIKDIYYVGMSNSLGGVKQRLKQFIRAIETGKSHSGGNRFFDKVNNKTPYSELKSSKKFFVQSLSLTCEVDKNKRKPEDLIKMGEVAKFEYEVLAYIKDKLGKEPELNKK